MASESVLSVCHRDYNDALQMGPRKKMSRGASPFVTCGRHFGRTIFALCSVNTLIQNGIVHQVQMDEEELDLNDFPVREQHEHCVFEQLLHTIPGVHERIFQEDGHKELQYIADQIQRGISGARADDMKTLKGVILNWISPRGQALQPPINSNNESEQGFNHEVTGRLLCPTGYDWNNPEYVHLRGLAVSYVH
ncbi:hypothetical protein OF83DRAFT_1173862 [Amylostereum chailletii]|nr:hypothetical protein OF83DRAFT_1173862 [Amylostereum chailletii]